MSIFDLYSSFKKLSESVKTFQKEAIESNKIEILETITQKQLYEKGIDGTGQSLGEYSPVTKVIKEAKGQPFDRVTLRDEGDFHRGFRLEDRGAGFEISSSDEKAPKLVKDWGNGQGSIYGLTDENKESIIETSILPDFLKLIGNV